MPIVQSRSFPPIGELNSKAEDLRRDPLGDWLTCESMKVERPTVHQRPPRLAREAADPQSKIQLNTVGKRARIGDGQYDLVVPSEHDPKRHGDTQDVVRRPTPLRLLMLRRVGRQVWHFEESHLDTNCFTGPCAIATQCLTGPRSV